MSIHAPSQHGFRSLLRLAASSIATPPWFATPVDADEDEDSITVVFHAPEKRPGQVRVEADEKRVTVWGARTRARPRPMRLCALSCAIDAKKIETARQGDLLRVRIPKKSGARASSEAPSSTA